jgi:hypothetical protein
MPPKPFLLLKGERPQSGQPKKYVAKIPKKTATIRAMTISDVPKNPNK